MKKVFPSALIYADTIIPPRGAHPLKKTVIYSNEQLKLACEIEQCMLVDNRDIFVTKNGAPRQRLYRDSIHPSPAGVAKLGTLLYDSIMLHNLSSHPRLVHSKKLDRAAPRPLPPYRPHPDISDYQNTQPPRRRPLLPTPSHLRNGPLPYLTFAPPPYIGHGYYRPYEMETLV